MADERKVAWILGAGFSRPLGGPLLNDLISRQMAGDFLNWPDFHEKRTPEGYDKVECAQAVQLIYELGCDQKNATFWSNPEEFLERLDLACRETTNLWAFRIGKLYPQTPAGVRALSPSAALDPTGGLSSTRELPEILVSDVKLLRREAIRFVAGACSYFTRDVGHIIDKLELWHPYFRWANKLRPEDVILTFNYDNVLDLMSPHLGQARLRWMMPKNADGELGSSGYSEGSMIFHLHGHVGWERNSSGVVQRGDPMAHLDPDKAIIGMPGPSKKELSEKRLAQVWNRAFYEMGNADVVTFVGYRFPESDGLARHSILEALRENQKARVRIVLGAHNPDTTRVKAMIDWTRTSAPSSMVEEMGAQDFFAAFERNRL